MRKPFIHILLIIIALCCSSCTAVWRSVVYNVPGVKDYKIFPFKTVENSGKFKEFSIAKKSNLPPLNAWGMGHKYRASDSMETFFKKTGTIGFLELQNDTIQFEYYAKGYDRESIFTTFSLAKVFVSTLVGIAIEERFIQNIEQPVADFLPRFGQDSLLKAIKIRHLLQMTSGLKGNETIPLPGTKISRLYYGKHLDKETANLKTTTGPGKKFKYFNQNTQLLSEILKAATGRSVAEYLEEKIWMPAGMEAPATWSLDREGGSEKAFCCINARARDFLRFGKLFLNQGYLNGKQIVPADWAMKTIELDTAEGSRIGYQYHWYTTSERSDFFGEGLIGQFLYVAPETNTVILRFGKKLEFTPWYDIFKILAHLNYKPGRTELSREQLNQFEGKYVFYNSYSGDSTLIGKAVTITRQKDYLKFKPEFRPPFLMYPASETLFFNEEDSRKIHFHFDENGKIISFDWSRRGNSWELVPAK